MTCLPLAVGRTAATSIFIPRTDGISAAGAKKQLSAASSNTSAVHPSDPMSTPTTRKKTVVHRAQDAAARAYASKGSPEWDYFIAGYCKGWAACRRTIKPKTITRHVYSNHLA